MARKAGPLKLLLLLLLLPLELSSLVSHGANIAACNCGATARRGSRPRFGDEITRINNPEVRGAQ